MAGESSPADVCSESWADKNCLFSALQAEIKQFLSDEDLLQTSVGELRGYLAGIFGADVVRERLYEMESFMRLVVQEMSGPALAFPKESKEQPAGAWHLASPYKLSNLRPPRTKTKVAGEHIIKI